MNTILKLHITRHRILLFFMLWIYILALQFAYQYFMLGVYAEDFLETSWGHVRGIENTALYISLLLFLAILLVSQMGKRTSDYLHLLFFLIPIAPMGIIAANKGVGLSYYVLVIIAFTISYTVSCLKIPTIFINLKIEFFTEKRFLLFCIALGVTIIAWMIANGGLTFFNINLSQVYEFRRGGSASRGTLLNYILLNYTGLIIGIGFAIAFARKNMLSLFALMVIIVAIYSFTSAKGHLFIGFFTIALCIIMNTRFPKIYLILGSVCIVIIFTLVYLIDTQQWILGTYFIRRTFFVPAYLNFMYWDFFNANPFAFWSDSKVSLGLVDSVYGRPTPQVIGDYFSGKDFSNTVQLFNNANTGWLGSGYGNAGAFGMFIYAFLSGLITKSANVLGNYIGHTLATAALGYYFFGVFFTSTDLPAALLSYGFFSYLIIMIFWKKPKKMPRNRANT